MLASNRNQIPTGKNTRYSTAKKWTFKQYLPSFSEATEISTIVDINIMDCMKCYLWMHGVFSWAVLTKKSLNFIKLWPGDMVLNSRVWHSWYFMCRLQAWNQLIYVGWGSRRSDKHFTPTEGHPNTLVPPTEETAEAVGQGTSLFSDFFKCSCQTANVMVMCVQPQVASCIGGYRKRLVLLLRARQEITRPCQLVMHCRNRCHAETEK